MSEQFDVFVVGGGLAGAGAAALLVRRLPKPARIALLAAEVAPPTDAAAPPDLRVAALSRASERILTHAGAWERLNPARLCAYERMRVWHESSSAMSAEALLFDAADMAEPNLGYIAENRELQRACLDSFIEAGGTLIAAGMSGMQVRPEHVEIEAGEQRLRAQLVVGADGANSSVRSHAHLGAAVHDYGQCAVVATVATARPHAATAWQRFLWGGPLALLPLFDGSVSIVWSVHQALARELCECTPAQFAARLDRASDLVLGATSLRSERLSLPLRHLRARDYVSARCALIGDAAHVVHPLAGQGANLGLLDAAALCEALTQARSEREDLGAVRILRRYEQQRHTHNVLMGAALSAFNYGFGYARGPAAWLVNRTFSVLNRSTSAKRFFAAQALGIGGELPPLARSAAV